jgi:hypothetical protein
VTLSEGEAAAACELVDPSITALIEKRPMWFVRHMTVNDPSPRMVEWAVCAHDQPVWWPRRSISIVLPAYLLATVPVNRKRFRSSAEARVATLTPLPLALTVTLPGLTTALVVVDVDAWPEPDGRLPPPESARPSAGTDNVPTLTPSSATT